MATPVNERPTSGWIAWAVFSARAAGSTMSRATASRTGVNQSRPPAFVGQAKADNSVLPRLPVAFPYARGCLFIGDALRALEPHAAAGGLSRGADDVEGEVPVDPGELL